MTQIPARFSVLTRRRLLALAAGATAVPSMMLAQETGAADGDAPAPAGPDDAALQQFTFDILAEEMRVLASRPHEPAPRPEGFLGDLDYDQYRLIRFNDARARWGEPGSAFRLSAFHMGWLFPEPVVLYEVADGMATEMRFTTEDFEYLNELSERVPHGARLPGVAGFRLNHALNRPDKLDELVAFVGASYFRALGRDNTYGLSARGLALNTATDTPEEFPRFSRFYMERGPEGAQEITVYATLESASVTGAYRFVIRPGAATQMDVTARLFFRQNVTELGVAPLTSMYLFSEKSRTGFDDFRPNVHDSDGLRIVRHDGDVIWRPLNNPPRVAGSYLSENGMRRFGLHQRARDFAAFQDTHSRYEMRPSLDVEPLGDWGVGHVRLVEIPSDLEANDNIVAFWVPQDKARAGDVREFAYRLHWGMLPLDPQDPIAHVAETRAGHAGFAGVEPIPGARKFVVDFAGGLLSSLEAQTVTELEPVVTVMRGELLGALIERLPGGDIWRLVIEVKSEPGALVEISAHIAGFDRKLTENWLYQWMQE
ncbi:glucan biosynthesis protein [Szabonella alba]|uniref:Glucan biosynthesis protein n=1 Tax=Szabonella alba TaxID=2804194 RepID=A0A8K0VA72_9RHOB|nr:glucan biosynthesis protein [Szabonella alba]MBL4916468.1 glucan biosynthesis protein [Szabonella alba]